METVPFFNRLVPAPSIPEFIKNGLRDIGGINPYGEPNLILEWGGDTLKWPHGPIKYLASTEKDGENMVRVGALRWFVSKWWSPAQVMIAGPTIWEQQRYEIVDGKRHDLLGPPPTRGQYRDEVCLQNPQTGEAIPLDNRILEYFRALKANIDAQTDLSQAGTQAQEWDLRRAIDNGENQLLEQKRKFHSKFKDDIRGQIEPLKRRIALGSRPNAGSQGHWRKSKAGLYIPDTVESK